MAGYRSKKEDKHDYASIKQKAIRKIHGMFYRKVGDKKKAYPLYRSYRHRNKKPVNGETSHFITEEPAYLAGFGHGLGAWRAGLIASTLLPASYAYSKMVNEEWDEVLGLGERFPQADELIRKGYKKVLLPYYDMSSEESLGLIRDIMASYNGQKVVFFNEYEQWTKKGDDIRGDELIREIFWASGQRKKDRLLYDPAMINVAVHIRRGDVETLRNLGDASMNRRWMELGYYTRLMKDLAENCPEAGNKKDLHFYVFSEGREENFAELTDIVMNNGKRLKITFCLDMAAPASFLHICHADIILAAPSSFSIEAGAICRGLKIVPDRDWLIVPDNDEWCRVDEEGVLKGKNIKEWICRNMVSGSI